MDQCKLIAFTHNLEMKPRDNRLVDDNIIRGVAPNVDDLFSQWIGRFLVMGISTNL